MTEELFNLSEEQYNEIRQRAFEGLRGVKWKQRGPYLVSTNLDYTIAIYIGTKKKMVGVDDDGTPILVDK